ncbi:MAG: prepilin-type N-terminal cleavage/methylation domain-containing protein [Candidatus Omnitrophica bacterium]|nr:prepilin-type N-terminal cleavage/methylation domain-containing protein [Candidatus Omnitrophota bacterium]
MYKHKAPIFLPKSSSNSFTLVELIVVIIIVGILAAVGMSQYSLIVEKARTAEAKVRIGAMRQLAYQYSLENGTLTGMQDADVGVNNTCASTDFYRYGKGYTTVSSTVLVAYRCTSGGKTPNAFRGYMYYLRYYPGSGQEVWFCHYDDGSPCFGLTPGAF